MIIDIHWNDLTDIAKSRIIETVGEDCFDDYMVIGILEIEEDNNKRLLQ